MKQAEPFLYPKLSSIYNKILQLLGAIVLIIILMSLWLSLGKKSTENLTEHFNFIAKQQLHQAIAGVAVLIEQPHKNKKNKDAILKRYLDVLAKVNFIKQAHLYNEKGQLIVSSVSTDKHHEIGQPPSASKSISDLYGITPFQRDLSHLLIPFIDEIRHTDITNNQLHGYLRFTIEQSYLTDKLAKANKEQQSLQRLMLLIAGLVGFLLTRGLNRFSRRGYRLAVKENKPV